MSLYLRLPVYAFAGLEGENRLNDPRTENVDAALSRGALGPVAVQRRAFLTESSPQPDKSKAYALSCCFP